MEKAEFFKKKVGRIRGEDFEQKISFLKNKWTKVIDDSEKEISLGRDTSFYRECYVDYHRTAIEVVETLSKEELRHFVENIKSVKYDTAPGTDDAKLYIILELEKVLEEVGDV